MSVEPMKLHVSPTATDATMAAADWLTPRLQSPETWNVVAGGNTPLALYQEISRSQPQLSHLNVFALDEYVGVPKEEPRNCANLSRRNMIEPRGNPEAQYHQVRSLKAEAGRSIRQHEMTIRLAGGLDVLVLGLGKNAHIGFNEPGRRRFDRPCAAADADIDRCQPRVVRSSTRLTWGLQPG